MASPLQTFIMGEQAALTARGQEQMLDRRGQIASQQNTQFDQKQALQAAQVMDQFVGRLKQIPDVNQRFELFNRAKPELQRLGVTLPPSIRPENLTDQGLVPLETGIGKTMSNLTAGQIDRKSRLEDVRRITDPNTGKLKENLTPEEKAIAIRERLLPGAQGSSAITIGTTPGLSQQVGEGQRVVKLGETRGKEQGKTESMAIQEGRDAAKGIPVLKRTLSLLDEVKTGGFDSAAIKAKQFFGVEGADEGELSANLGQSVLGDLRATFGAAFTEKEGQRLERIRANLSRSPAANRRLISQALQIAQDAAERAMDNAIDSGDVRTAEEIQELLDFTIRDEAPKRNASSTPPVNQQGWRLMRDAQGNSAYVSPDGSQFEEVR